MSIGPSRKLRACQSVNDKESCTQFAFGHCDRRAATRGDAITAPHYHRDVHSCESGTHVCFGRTFHYRVVLMPTWVHSHRASPFFLNVHAALSPLIPLNPDTELGGRGCTASYLPLNATIASLTRRPRLSDLLRGLRTCFPQKGGLDEQHMLPQQHACPLSVVRDPW